MSVVALVTCHNRAEITLRGLSALLPQLAHFGESRVCLVDDRSSDETVARVQGLQTDLIEIFSSADDLFWARGMALAWKMALRSMRQHDFFLWLNDDVALRPGAVEGMVEDWKRCGDLRGVIVGACSEDDAGTISSYGATDRRDVRIIPNGKPQLADGWFNGNVVLVPKATYEAIGMISDEYSHGRADYDYAERLKRAGIPFFCSSKYVGVCHNDFKEKMAAKSRWEKFAALWRPGYLNLHDLWIFKYRYYGFWRAVVSILHAILLAFK